MPDASTCACVGTGRSPRRGCTSGRPIIAVRSRRAGAFKEAPPDGWKEARAESTGFPAAVVGDLQRSPAERARSAGRALEPERDRGDGADTVRRATRCASRVRRSFRRSPRPRRHCQSQLAHICARKRDQREHGVQPECSRLRNHVGRSRVDYSMPVDLSYQADVWGSIRRSVAAAPRPRRRPRPTSRTRS